MKIKSYTDFINEELQRVISDQSGSGRTRSIDTILDDPSSAKSPSSSILLRKKLKDQEFDDLKNLLSITGYKDVPDWVIKDMAKNGLEEPKLKKLRVTLNNLKFLKDKAEEGELYCEYCNKGPLKIYDFKEEFNKEDGATCDHKHPQSKGGDKFDYSNLAVCCHECNKKKGNMTWDEWMKYLS